ncbi:unnamed protein product [Lactuca saligna]|uniref:TPX2 central domain-containing protein n=1 Tax=Lactuca saligna TaxID=75948 RepID=A0AA36A0L8_LACSI|nr:unnamed protein product [Lactuca saligna]
MDEEMEIMQELLADEDSFSNEIDSEYEFDACQFFDFTRGETESEAEEAESWFRYAHEYPPSPFILKLKMMKAAKAKANQMKSHKTSFRKKTSTSSISDGGDIDHEAPSKEAKIKGVKHHNHTPQDNSKTKSKSTVNSSKPSGSSFMKPTASHLAKQNKERDTNTHSGGHGRVQKPLVSPGEKLTSPPSISSNQPTKRQKLEIGYLRKVAQLKHRTTFMHKIVKKVAEMENNSNSRCNKTTIPQKPELVTEEKAQKLRSHNKSEAFQQPKANTLKSQSFNRKVNACDNLTLCKQKSAPPMIEEILIQSKNSGNDKSRSPNNLKASNSAKVHPIKEGGFILNSQQNSHMPPIELFKKLSLKNESDTKVISFVRPPGLSKGLKENMARSFQQEFRRCAGKPNQCGNDRRITELKT